MRRSYHLRHGVALLTLVGLVSACGSTAPVTDAVPEQPPGAVADFGLIPIPVHLEVTGDDVFLISDNLQIVVPGGAAEADRIARMLADLIGNTRERMPMVVEAGQERPGPAIHLRLASRADLGAEGYVLEIDPQDVRLTAATPAGLFFGTQTLRQLLPAYVEYGAALAHPLWLPSVRITDVPRFGWRGAMLDVARHFLGPDDVKRYIDLMSLYKLNRLHLHLSDDQGWRIDIPGWPRLTEVGGSTQVGGKGGGYYTGEEYAALVQYAADRFITIVPEIDMPGHTNAALASYPELTCDGVAPELYTGTRVGFSYLCVEKEETYRFVDDVVRALAERTPGPYFHLGGDEVDELTEEQYVSFMERAQEIVARHGKTVVGWDEIAEVDLALRPGTVVQVWRPQSSETADWLADAVASGARLLLAPADRVYLDMKYDSTTVLGLAWAGYNSVQDAYDWEPARFVPGIDEQSIEGVEAPLWAETIDQLRDFEYLAFPQLAGVAEIGWSPAERRSWNDYRLRLATHAPRWTALGVNFYRSPDVDWWSVEDLPQRPNR